MPWNSWINAEIYDRFVRERKIYLWLNREMVRLADVGGAGRILDLGCGTGATTTACLRVMDARAEIVGVDASSDMIALARANIMDPRARFEVALAARLDRIEGVFDRVVCNAAFWQFRRPSRVLGALSRRTRPGATFVFNVPAERVRGEDSPVHSFQVSLMRAIETELGRPLDAAPARVDPRRLAKTAAEHGFSVASIERLAYEGRQDELMELMSIPAMIVPLTPGLSDEQREAVMRRARERSDPQQTVVVPWIYFILERSQEGEARSS